MTRSDDARRRESRDRIVTALKILNVRLRFILLMAAVGIVAAQWDGIVGRVERLARPARVDRAGESTHEFYCPMHPSVVRGEHGSCPICGMPLTKRLKGEAPELPEGVLGRVQLSPHRIQLAGVGTTEVGFRRLATSVRAAGTIELDERRVARIAARVPGRIERLAVDFTGETIARRGILLEIYSPELVAAGQEYLLALASYERLEEEGAPAASEAKRIFDAARERLRLWGVGDDQIAEMEAAGAPFARMPIRSPLAGTIVEKHVSAGQYVEEGADLYSVADLTTVWLIAHVYEADIGRIAVGDRVKITAAAFPEREFRGEVSFVAPLLDTETRTVRVRADVANPDGALRPGMYADAVIEAIPREAAGAGEGAGAAAGEPAADRYLCPMHPEVEQGEPGRCPKCGMFLEKVAAAPGGAALVVPETAVIDTGSRKVVYIEREPGTYDAVAVEIGPLADGHYPVHSGLAPGEKVVTAGAFLVDAENRLNPGAAGSYFGASGGPSDGSSGPAHGHD